MNCIKFFICFLFFIGCSYAKFSYEGYQLISLKPLNPDQLKLISELEHNEDFDVWTRVKLEDHNVVVCLSSDAFIKYKPFFQNYKIEYEVYQENLQKLIDMQEESMLRRKSNSIVGRYARYNEIINFIETITEDNQDLASSYIAGYSHENRALKVAVLKTASSKSKVWIDCGIHAREWITPATCVWIIDSLVKEYREGRKLVVDLLDRFEFHIMPLYNPDGYEYSHTQQRLWRKNRRINEGSRCVGVDLNRNNGFQWLVAGASPLPCSDGYAGPVPDSEPETKAVQASILKYQGEWTTYLTLHTYGQWWFTTWGYTRNLPGDYDEMYERIGVGVKRINEIYPNESQWTYGSSARILEPLAGGSEDWTKAIAGIKHSYSMELRPSHGGVDSEYGFVLPEDRAPRAGEETYEGILAYLNTFLLDEAENSD